MLKSGVEKKQIFSMIVAFLIVIWGIFSWQKKEARKEAEEIALRESTMSAQLTASAPSPTPTNVPPTEASTATPILTPTPTPDPFANWTSYTNNTYKYRFLYDPGWKLSTQGNSTTVQGDISVQGWPSINVSKLTIVAGDITSLKTQVESLFGETTSEVLIGLGSIPAVLLERAASPQAYAGKDYYFLNRGNVLMISLNDTGHTEGDRLYDYFLGGFEVY
jgi:hypothetical protein